MALLALMLVFAGAAVFFTQQVSEKKEQEGKSALYKIQKTFEEEEKVLTDAEKQPGSALDVDARFSKTVSELNGLLAAKSASARVLYEAAMKLGTLYLDHLQYEKAASVIKTGAEFAKTDFQKVAAQFLLGVAQEQNRKFSEALEAYQAALSRKTEGLSGELLLGAVRVSLKLNDKVKAAKFLEQLNKDMKGSKAAEAAEALVKEAK
ncbi:MAG: hypothetical protein EBX52_01735 [Proteobacteria bacterium]|nr:hypothetical protein [Pseudomonadota bacterium]